MALPLRRWALRSGVAYWFLPTPIVNPPKRSGIRRSAFRRSVDKTQWTEQYLRICHLPAKLEFVARRTVAFEGLLDPDVESGRQP